ncbi:DNA replication ATP-dependent helicase/nuclease DNA2 isoform X1 [Alosa sapidissima]|uniref:DNA replication ATP-dependent helicase/nuclease DNA2 isoform X1 n=1 Tax=Alosa sapidissima TaxID=34773 RepID=UPI001C090F48|nr:DNA replication ATP-dependent helicase/nuclease DNA2 isoform X1 [Alosa sapidissima]
MPTKLQKRSAAKGGFQGNIASFFSPKVVGSCSYKKNVPVKTKDSPGVLVEDTENVPLSPECTIVPETPDSLIKPHNHSGVDHDVTRSPVSRSPSSRGSAVKNNLFTRMPMRPLQNESPKAKDQDNSKSDRSHVASAKRRMFSPDEPQRAKRVRAMPVKRPSRSPLKDPSSSAANGLNDYIEEIRCLKSTNSHTKPGQNTKQAPKPLKAGQITFTTDRKKSGPVPQDSRREKTLSEASCSHSNKGNGIGGSTFTSISKPKPVEDYDFSRDLAINGELVCSFTCDVPEEPTRSMESTLFHPSRGGIANICQAKHRSTDGKATQDDLQEELDDSWFDEKMEPFATEPKEKLSKSEKTKGIPDNVILSTGLHNRYWVLDIQETTGPHGYLEKHLTITASKTTQPTETCILKDGWESTPVAVGDIVHVEGECVSGTWVIGRDSGFLVLLPDVLISGTSIANSIRCMRRAVLGEIFKGFDGGSKQMLTGTIVHEIFQRAAMSMNFSEERLKKLAQDALLSPNYLGQIYSLSLPQEDIRQGVEEYLPSLSEWAKDYLDSSSHSGNKPLTLKLPSDGRLNKQDSGCTVTVTDFTDIEENIWSPRFGLKGKIDVTASVRIHRRGRRSIERVVPLELKTGKESNSIEHRSQVILYTLMSLERRADPEAGFLIYLKTGSLHPIVGNHMDRRELIKLRNMLAHHLGNNLEKAEGGSSTRLTPLPDVISDQQACRYCPQKQNCAVYNKALERDPSGDPSGPEPPFLEQESAHLSLPHLHYFSHWVLLCALEARTMEAKGGRRNIWLQSAQEREKSGGCLGNLLRTGKVTALADDVHQHFFERQGGIQALTGLVVGDRVVVSDQDSKLIGVATGFVTEVSNAGVSCSLDRDLSRLPANMVFRLDQDEGAGGLSTHFGNISKLMENSPTSQRLRELIVDFRRPQFIDSLSSVLPRDAKDTVANILKGLNKPQKQAMKKVLLSKDYTLIVGMPGTGKTTTICTLVRILHACGFSVLLTSYTHSAVDNILLKLKKFKIGFLRLGRAQKVHPDIRPFTDEQCRAKGITNLSDLEHLYNKELVVATTCMGVKHALFSRRRFDFCIVDEASQISQPVCLGPLFYAQRFVLVGDHQQLPPIVQNSEARALGMDESLFKRLEHHSNAVVQLTVQYRMNSKIMSLSNALMYEGKLECGSERMASAVLKLATRDSVEQDLELFVGQEEYTAWIRTALQPLTPVCFLDTTKVPAIETVEKGGISNHIEATLVHAIVSLLLKAGCKAANIGIIAPYRQQLKAISGLLDSPAFSAVEVNTVDKYQGRDKSVIIVSFVRSSMEANMGELLKDWRRLNVAITRAKHKLIMIGSVSTLRRYAPLEKLLSHLEQESMVFQLPVAAHEALPPTFL